MNHTPGPWIVRIVPGELFEIRGANEIVLRLRGGMMPIRDDASLLEAAPDLLDCVKRALPELRQLAKDIGPCDHDVNICVCGVIRLADDCEAAIAKAGGVDEATQQFRAEILASHERMRTKR
jgi:hypothetical protein